MGKATRRAPHQTFPWFVWVYGWCAGRCPSVLAHEVMCFCPCRATVELVQYAYPTRASNLRNPPHYPQSEINVHFWWPYSQYSISSVSVYTSNWPASRRARPSTNYMLPSMIFDYFERISHPWHEQSNCGNNKNQRVLMHVRTSTDNVRFEPLQLRHSYFLW